MKSLQILAGIFFLIISVVSYAENSEDEGDPVSPAGGGNLIWAKSAGGSDSYQAWAITTLSDDSTVVTGRFMYSATFGKGEHNEIVLTSAGGWDVFVARYSPNGTLDWAKHPGGSGRDEGYAITTLSDNSTVVTGSFSDSAIFGKGEANEIVLTPIRSGFSYIFIARYNPDGTLAWVKCAGPSYLGSGQGFAITTLSDNSTVVTGAFYNSATFGEGEANETVLTSPWENRIFIARYNPDGTLAWAKRAGGSTYWDWGYGITNLSDNSTVVTGRFVSSTTFGEGEPNETVLTSAGSLDIFIARYSPDGTLAWAKRAGGSDSDYGYAITTLSDNSTIVTGGFDESATFGEGEPNETVLHAGYQDIFIARYNPNGTLAWARRAGGSYFTDYGYAITTLSDNSTVVTGKFSNSATFGEGEPNETVLTSDGDGDSDVFIARYNPDGTLAWAKHTGGSSWNQAHAITTLSDNSIVVTGWFYASTTLCEGDSNQTVLNSDGYRDILIARYNPDGTLAWAKRSRGSYSDSNQAWAITTLSDNSTVVTGNFTYSATFGEGERNETVLTATSYEESDIFIARYNPGGTLAWAKRAGGSSSTWDERTAITTLTDNSIVVTGGFQGSATFGEDEPNETVLNSYEEAFIDRTTDIFIARYNPDGTLVWAKRAGSPYWDVGRAITTLSDNSTVVTGSFMSSATFGEGERNETVLTSYGDGQPDIFIAQYNPDGTLAWAKRAGSPYWDVGSAITTLSDNSTVVTGKFAGSASFSEGEANETVLTPTGYPGISDIFIARYNQDGTLAWAKRAGGSNIDSGSAITTLSDNSTVVTGSYKSSATFGEGERNETVLPSYGEGRPDIFIAQYNPDGTLAWAKRAGSPSEYEEGKSITTLSDDSVVVTGNFTYSATFGEGEPNETVLTATSYGESDIFIARYNPGGTLAWAKRAGGSDSDVACSITTLSDNSTVMTGLFSKSAAFGEGEPNEIILSSYRDSDIFIARYSE